MHRDLIRLTRCSVRVMPSTHKYFSTREPPKGNASFLTRLYDNFREEMNKSKEMKESLRKFREEAQRLEQSEALRAARKKFESVEKEASKGGEVFKERLISLRDRVQGVIDEAGKSNIVKKAGQLSQEIGRTASSISEKAQELGKSETFQKVSKATSAIKEEISTNRLQSNVYVSPTVLRKRSDISAVQNQRVYEANTQATGMELHKDSRFYESWQNFKDNNPYVHKVLHWKMKYDESENPVIRASRALTEKVSDVMGGLFQKTELSETLTEICRIDPSFDTERFLKQCECDIIPNVLEAMTRGDLEILKDWCHEGPYNLFAAPFKEAFKKGYKIDSKILDVDNVDLVMGKVMDQGPVLIISFTSQQMMCVRDASNVVVEGDPDKIMRVSNVWVLCRDISEMDPRAAWKLLDLSASSTEQLV